MRGIFIGQFKRNGQSSRHEASQRLCIVREFDLDTVGCGSCAVSRCSVVPTKTGTLSAAVFGHPSTLATNDKPSPSGWNVAPVCGGRKKFL